jgi:hypothetical protein
MRDYAELGDTVYFWFATNDTSGSGDDGASAVYDVRLAGAAAGAAPVLSGSATLLTHASYPAGCYEVAIAATSGNGFATNSTYGVFATAAVDAQNPTGLVGSFALGKALTGADFGLLLETTVASVTSQSIIVLTDGSTFDSAYSTRLITIQDASDLRFIDVVCPSAYTGATKTLTMSTPTATFSVAAGDTVRVYKEFHPTLVRVPANVTHVLGQLQTGTGTVADYYRPA